VTINLTVKLNGNS